MTLYTDETLEVLRDQYCQEQIRKERAQKRLSSLIHEISRLSVDKSSTIVDRHTERLSTHLNSLRAARQQRTIDVVSHYYQKADLLASEAGSVEALSSSAKNDPDGQERVRQAQVSLNTSLQRADTLKRDLELALVKARQRLKHEKDLRNRVKHEHTETNASISSTGELRALESTRNELQTWMNDVLAACESGTSSVNTHQQQNRVATEEARQSEIDEAYQQYIVARKRVWNAVEVLKKPLPILNLAKQPQRCEKATPLTVEKQIQSIKHEQGLSLGEIETLVLPGYHDEKILQSYQHHLERQTDIHREKLQQTLNLLSHESHLLPAHSVTDNDLRAMQHNLSDFDNENDVQSLIIRWYLASKAADSRLDENVQGNISDATTSLENADNTCSELDNLETLWKQVSQS